METTRRSKSAEACAKKCLECYAVCTNALEYCITKGGKYIEADLLRLLRVTAELCQTNAFLLLSHSKYHNRTCAVCAELCDACAASCEPFQQDELLADCAQTCRDCSTSCLSMSAVLAA